MKGRCDREWSQRSFWCSLGKIWGWDHNPKQLNNQQRGQHRRLGNAHGARDDLVEASCVSFASVQARKLNHYAASPLPTKPSGFAGSPRRASEKRIVGSLGKPVHFRPHKKRQYTALRALLSGTSLHLLDFNAWRSAIFSDQITFTNIFGRPCGKFVDAI